MNKTKRFYNKLIILLAKNNIDFIISNKVDFASGTRSIYLKFGYVVFEDISINFGVRFATHVTPHKTKKGDENITFLYGDTKKFNKKEILNFIKDNKAYFEKRKADVITQQNKNTEVTEVIQQVQTISTSIIDGINEKLRAEASKLFGADVVTTRINKFILNGNDIKFINAQMANWIKVENKKEQQIRDDKERFKNNIVQVHYQNKT